MTGRRTPRPVSRFQRAARRALIGLAAVANIWLGGLIWFANGIPSAGGAAIPDERTDAVVVLTGGPLRLKTGLEILEAGKAQKLFVTGVAPRVEMNALLHAAKKSPESESVNCCIVLGHEAADTAGNAAETRQWMEREGFHSLRLVTASYHMPRSLLEFRRAMPDVTIVAHPVFPEGFMRNDWWAWPGTLKLIVSEYQKYLVAATRSWISTDASASGMAQ